ncbi:hypothetical protein EU546_06500 [Candidatus Thorarchaeota archaeon]|nr:MAG: hypothetical protein EU546_06500 [Candidatus Thorarchaeota archaeon]
MKLLKSGAGKALWRRTMLFDPGPRLRMIIGERRTVAGFSAAPDMKLFNRLIRKRKSMTESEPVRKAIATAERRAGALVHTASIYGLYQPDSQIQTRFPDAVYAALALVTIGSELEDEVAQLSSAGDTSAAFLLDAWGSAFVEGAVEVIDAIIRREAQSLGLDGGKRRSPGYPPWGLEEQATIIHRLDGSIIGVRLTDTHTMLPRKSVSFGIPFSRP